MGRTGVPSPSENRGVQTLGRHRGQCHRLPRMGSIPSVVSNREVRRRARCRKARPGHFSQKHSRSRVTSDCSIVSTSSRRTNTVGHRPSIATVSQCGEGPGPWCKIGRIQQKHHQIPTESHPGGEQRDQKPHRGMSKVTIKASAKCRTRRWPGNNIRTNGRHGESRSSVWETKNAMCGVRDKTRRSGQTIRQPPDADPGRKDDPPLPGGESIPVSGKYASADAQLRAKKSHPTSRRWRHHGRLRCGVENRRTASKFLETQRRGTDSQPNSTGKAERPMSVDRGKRTWRVPTPLLSLPDLHSLRNTGRIRSSRSD